MLPETWKLKTVRATASQFRVVRELLRDPRHEQIICATDAGREGEHIFRLIYEQARCQKPVQRLWISSLTDHAIRQGFRQLRPSSDFDALAQAARARAQADWLVGMNLTRAYTVHNGVLCTIGRVQTPTLAMVVARDEAIARFTRAFFYELVAGLNEGFSARYSRDGQTRIDAKEEAERLHEQLAPCKTGTVTHIEKKTVRHRPPSLYNLTDLQRDANRRFGVTAAQVLKCAQALYEVHKLITYPRTESRHLPRDLVEHLPGVLSGLPHPQVPLALERLRQGHRLNTAYVDDTNEIITIYGILCLQPC
jgi:DNA topoisomerase-3